MKRPLGKGYSGVGFIGIAMQVDVLMRHTLGRPVPILQNTGHEAPKKPTPPATAEPHFKLGKLPSCRRPYPTPHDARTSKCSLNDVDTSHPPHPTSSSRGVTASQGRPSHRTWQTTQISVQDGQRCSWRGCTNIPHRDFKIPGSGMELFPLVLCLRRFGGAMTTWLPPRCRGGRGSVG